MTPTGVVGSARRTRLRALAIVAALGVLLPFALSARASETLANWSDSEATTGAFTAAVVGPPGALPCNAGIGKSATFSWTHPSTGLARTSYHIVVTLNGSTVLNSSTVLSTTTSYTIPTGVLSIGSGTFSVRAVSDSWESTAVTGTFSVLGILVLLSTSCANT
jgi:predicted ribosomally synthesized peptide with SipW-like signal peptide